MIGPLGALNTFFDRIYTRSKCEKLIKYQARVFEFSDLGIEILPFKISLGGFRTYVETIEQAGESAKALDDFQYLLCKDLENKTLKEQLDKETWTSYIKTRFAANALVLGFRQTLEAFKNDPERQAINLDNIIKDIQNLVRSMAGNVGQKYNTPAGHDAISMAISRVKITHEGRVIDETGIDKLLSSKFDEFEKTQSLILRKISGVEKIIEESQIKSILLQSRIRIYTSETKINSGNHDSWLLGHFSDREVKMGYDARRPVTDKIVESIENNYGTIVYGDPYTGRVRIRNEESEESSLKMSLLKHGLNLYEIL